ncbi:MAG: alpha/beta hydrolase fold domain-containing protein [Planctomycetota bacterium]
MESTRESPPEAPGYASEILIMAAIATGRIKTIESPKEMLPGVQLLKDVEFGKGGGRSLTLDLYTPVTLEQPVPGLIFIHGGAWKGGNKDMYRPYAARYAQRGYVVASISYRLSSEAPFPAAVEDAKCAVRWMRANAGKYRVDPNHICVLGGSAGGHLAMMVGYSSQQKDLEGAGGHPGVSSKVQAVVNIYGPCDLTVPGIRDVDVVRQFLADKKYDEAPELYRKASPLLHLSCDDPPTLILHGTLDSLVPISQSDELVKRLRQVGVTHTYDRLEGWPHVMDLAEIVFNRCVFFIDKFLAEHMPIPEPVTAESAARH